MKKPWPSPGRIPCEVIGCRRTGNAAKYDPGTRIICAKCWRLGDRRDRLIFRRCDKRMNMGQWKTARGINLRYVRHQAWDRILKKAIERRVGITA